MLFWSGTMKVRVTSHESRARSMRLTNRQHSRASRAATRNSRRGILLLVVLSMLTLFLLIGTAFIVTSKQYQQANKTRARLTETSNSSIDQQDLLNEVLNQLLRDTNNLNSSMRFHSLLRDMYGSDGIYASVSDVGAEWAHSGDGRNVTSGQVLQFRLNPNNVTDQIGLPLQTLSMHRNAYNGLVLTFLDGPARGQSVRIIGHVPVPLGTSPQTYNAVLRVITPSLANGSTLTNPENLKNSRIAINGRPFNGTGFGYDQTPQPLSLSTTMAKLTASEALTSSVDPSATSLHFPVALMPNSQFFNPVNLLAEDYLGGNFVGQSSHQAVWDNLTPLQQELLTKLHFGGIGGSDESYDAVDFQNMALGLLQPSAGETVLPILTELNDTTISSDPITLGNMVLPSFHRPAMLSYWRTQRASSGTSTLQDEPLLLRKILLRPNWIDHPNFDGSNPDFINTRNNVDRLRRMIYGPWDVDNDSDGVRDSVWIDAGLPVMQDADGRLVKPLVAMLVLDMDGRLNLNAHGSEDIANSDFINFNRLDGALAGNLDTDSLPHGQGYGPAEVSLDVLMPGTTRIDRWEWQRRIFQGENAGRPIDALNVADLRRFRRRATGKYGQWADANTSPLPGVDRINVFDTSAQLKMQGVPRWADGNILNSSNTAVPVQGGYGTLPDFRGRYGLGLNSLGQPVYEAIADQRTVRSTLDTNTPYEVDLSLRANRGESLTAPDGPYTVAELERILRSFDADAGALPSRIWEMAGEFKDTPTATVPNLDRLNQWRTSVTTDSYDLPVPSVVVPAWMYVGPDGLPGGAGDDDNDGSSDWNDPDEIGSLRTDDYQGVMDQPPTQATFADLLEYRIRIGQRDTDRVWRRSEDNAARRQMVQARVALLLPREMAEGRRLDINRPLGNGRDDNNNGVVDEPGELDATGVAATGGDGVEPALWQRDLDTPLPRSFLSPDTAQYRDAVDRNGDGVINNIERGDLNNDNRIDLSEAVYIHNMRRQDLARDLYVLAMTLIEPLPVPAVGPADEDYQERKAQRARKLAQWAINVVDYRDPDNIMTAFEYDINPFDGWGGTVPIDGRLTTRNDIYGQDQKPGGALGSPNFDVGGVVWGAEAPELLMTETLAWHDRKTIDTQREGEPSLEEADSQEKADVGPRPKQDQQPFDASQDQRERPQGVAFVELYCPLAENPAASADTHLIDNGGNDLGINLAAIVRDPNNNQIASPVWRMTVYKRGGPGLHPEDPDEDNQPTDLKGEPRADRSVYFAGFDPETVDRPNPAFSWEDDGVAFFNEFDERNPGASARNKVPPVRPGRYMVVGAGEEMGPGEYLAKFGENNASNSRRGIWLRTDTGNNAVELTNSSGNTSMDSDGFSVAAPLDPTNSAATRPLSLSSVAIINQTANNPTPGADRIFNVSEPAGGYPRSVRVESEKGFSNSAWDETQQRYVPILDIPLDQQRLDIRGGGGINDPQRRQRGTLFDGDTRLALPADDQGDRTIPNFSWIYLQRLANPLLQWNPPARQADGSLDPNHDPNLEVNPYMTVDSMGVNVTVFNGLSDREYALQGGDHKSYANNYSMRSFASQQRGRWNDATTPYDANVTNLQERIRNGRTIPVKDPAATPPPFAANLYGIERIEADSYWRNNGGPSGNGNEGDTSHFFEALPDCTLGFLNEPFRGTSRNPKIEPEQPFPWLTWNNRPFANAGELLMVPAFNGLDLLQTFSYSNSTANPRLENYRSDINPNTLEDNVTELLEDLKQANSNLTAQLQVDGRYGHLLNFFRTEEDSSGVVTDNTNIKGIAGLYRILDYVHVPSPYVSTETWLNPRDFGSAALTSIDDPRYSLQPPFNRVSSYREPGRMNINTITSPDVWEGGVLHRELLDPSLPWGEDLDPTFWASFIPPGRNFYQTEKLDNPLGAERPGNPRRFYHTGPNTFELTDSRRGYGVPTSPGLQLNSLIPTFFGNPFRSADSVDHVPIPAMLLDRSGEPRESVQATMLRRNEFAQPPNQPPLFAANTADDPTTPANPGVDPPNHENSFRDSNRNPHFRYQPISRLSSMTTQRSNVYAVWITIGFFEVQKAPDIATFRALNDPNLDDLQVQALYDMVYPEGYQFGQEAGIDTGNVRRVREFAMIDRTIPVAFEPGKNHNVDKAIRLRRRLQ